ncbi:PQQ-binding-like beta-propeller repeat protein [Verrucomicrobiota bacterium]
MKKILSLCIVMFVSILGVNAENAAELVKTSGVKGGLVVCVGADDPGFITDLHVNDRYLVHAIDLDQKKVAAAREYIQGKGLYGKVSVDAWDGKRLPYADNLVNLIVMNSAFRVPRSEFDRVLAPRGVAMARKGSGLDFTGGGGAESKRPDPEEGLKGWTMFTKPVPSSIDDWTHYLHGSDNNAVAKDKVAGPPKRMQWLAKPEWTRSHDVQPSVTSIVTAGGRIFYVHDEATLHSVEDDPEWALIARDAFNGMLLWKQPVSSWGYHLRNFRTGPVQLHRLLVCDEGNVYAQLGLNKPVSLLDAASGEIKKVFAGTENAEELILNKGILFVVVGAESSEHSHKSMSVEDFEKLRKGKSIVAVDAGSGKLLWKWPQDSTTDITPLTLAVNGDHVYMQEKGEVVCLNVGDGKKLWRSSGSPQKKESSEKSKKGKQSVNRYAGWSMITLVATKDAVVLTDSIDVWAYSSGTGKLLWLHPIQGKGFFSKKQPDIFVQGNIVWFSPAFSKGRDLITGEVVSENDNYWSLLTGGHHPRCYRAKATENYIIAGKRGLEFVDLKGDNHSRNNWVRGACEYGMMPANGLIYAPPHTCGCYVEAQLYGFWALAPAKRAQESGIRSQESGKDRLIKGLAYGNIPQSAIRNPQSDWPMYRGDAKRRASTSATVPSELKKIWTVGSGLNITAPVIADGIVMVASKDTHQVIATDAASGKEKWTFTAGSRIDSPPAIYKGKVLFGCMDGYVYCLSLSDGKMVWRFRAAPQNMNTVVFDQLESLWPVHGSVLIKNDLVYFCAGRSSYLDGGIYLFALKPDTGEVVYESVVKSGNPGIKDKSDNSDAFTMEGVISDMLVSEGDSIYLKHMKFNDKLERQDGFGRHLFSTSRILDDKESHRSHLMLGGGNFKGINPAYEWAVRNLGSRSPRFIVPVGMLLSYNDDNVCGVRRKQGKEGGFWNTIDFSYVIYNSLNKVLGDDGVGRDFSRSKEVMEKVDSLMKWQVPLDTRPQAIVMAGDKLLVGGYGSAGKGLLQIMSLKDGKKVKEYELAAPPVFDGMAVAGVKLFVSLQNGSVVCWE